MAVSLPYLVSYKNVPTLFDKISSAKIPEKFSRDFLNTTIGLKASSDRALIPLLRNLGFIDQSGTPTKAYPLLKGDKKETAIADGVKKAYAPLFDADQEAFRLTGDKLKSLVAQIAGTDDSMTNRIAFTFSALAKLGDFEGSTSESEKTVLDENKDDPSGAETKSHIKGLRTEFHYNIQVHLPSNGTEETYLNIFNALRKTFQ